MSVFANIFILNHTYLKDNPRYSHRFAGLCLVTLLLLIFVETWSVQLHFAGPNIWTSSGPFGGIVETIAVDPTHQNILYAGTFSSSPTPQGGIFKSFDAGRHWVPVNSGLSTSKVYAIAVSANFPDIVFAGTDKGVYKSTSGGETWINTTPSSGLIIYGIAIDPTNSTNVYAVGSTGLLGSFIILKSSDSGLTWAAVKTGLGGRTFSPVSLVVDPLNPSNVYVGLPGSGVYKSTDSGATWTAMNNGLPTQEVRALAMESSNPAVIYAAVEGLQQGSGGIFKTTDAGNTWLHLNNDTPSLSASILILTPNAFYMGTNFGTVYRSTDKGGHWSSASVGLTDPEVHALAAGPSSTIYAGTHGAGIFATTNNGDSWTVSNVGLISTEVDGLAIAGDGVLYAGLHAGGMFKKNASDKSWAHVDSAPDNSIFSLGVDPIASNILYIGTYNGSGIYKSTDGGLTWTASNSGMGETGVLALAIAPARPSTIYLGTFQSVFRSTDSAATWTRIVAGLPQSAIYDLQVDPVVSSTVYAATDKGVYKSSDGGESWVPKNNGITGISSLNARGIAIDPRNSATLYVGTAGGLFKTTDGGDHWAYSSSGLTNSVPPSLQRVLVDPSSPSTLYAGTYSNGVYKSSDGGSSWHAMNLGLPQLLIFAMAINPADPATLHIATSAGVYSFTSAAEGVPQVTFEVFHSAAHSIVTQGLSPLVQVGYADVNMEFGDPAYATAIFSFRQNGVIVSECGIPVSPPTTRARVFIDYRTQVLVKRGAVDAGLLSVINTGLALVNPANVAANVQFLLRSSDGTQILAQGSGTIAPRGHVAKFISELRELAQEFNLPVDFSTTIQFASLEISSDQPLSILALRLTSNQRGETLVTSTPIADLTMPASSTPLYFPQLTDGGGYQFTLILMNTSSITERGTIQLLDDFGTPFPVRRVEDQTTQSQFSYNIPPGGLFRLTTDGSPESVKTGWVKVIASDGTPSPRGAGIFGFTQGGVLVTESGVPAASPMTHARIYIDKSGGHDTGLAIGNVNSSVQRVLQTAYQTDGVTPMGSTWLLDLAANVKVARFVGEIIPNLPSDFTGVLDISSSSPFVALTLRSLSNARGDFLLTTFPIADFNQPAPAPVIFPQIADGGGYQTQFVFLNAGGSVSRMTLDFLGDDGSPLPVGKRKQ
jgi:photosystem II stability/assembly factor-like uncharacterized protein